LFNPWVLTFDTFVPSPIFTALESQPPVLFCFLRQRRREGRGRGNKNLLLLVAKMTKHSYRLLTTSKGRNFF
jgi:hypothetical protein